ncbi:methyltransf_25 domain-containing protein, partial [Haematococcus lacustris]
MAMHQAHNRLHHAAKVPGVRHPFCGPLPQRHKRAVAAAATSTSQGGSSTMLMAMVEALFKFQPFFAMATKQARAMVVKRAESIGLDWDGAMKELEAQDWQARMKAVTQPSLQYPAYYTQPFHAYPHGNL